MNGNSKGDRRDRRRVVGLTVGLLMATTATVSCSDTAGSDGDLATGSMEPGALAFRSGHKPLIRVVEPAEGAVVTSPFEVVVEVENYELAPSGSTQDGAGHFHLIVDRGCLETGERIPKDAIHLHFGSGSDRGEVELPPGRHQLCAQIGDGFHVAVSIVDSVEITVADETPVEP